MTRIANSRILVNILISSSFLILFIYNSPQAEAKSGQLEVSHSFDDTQYFCGVDGKISITIKNIDSSHQLKITWVGIHFDWLQSGYYYYDNNSNTPVMLASGQSTDVFAPEISVPAGTSISDHSWNIHINYQEGGLWWSDETWDSATMTNFKVVDYSLSIFPTSATITQGSKATFTVTVTGQNGFSKSVDLSTTGVPSGASTAFSSESISGSGTSTLSVEASSSASVGSYSITVEGKSGYRQTNGVMIYRSSATKTTMTSITINSAGILGGGGGSIAGISNGLIIIIGIIIVIIIGAVLGIAIMKKRKITTIQPIYQQPSPQYSPPPQPMPQTQIYQQIPPVPPIPPVQTVNAPFCGRCGRPLSPENMFCPSCGAPRS